MPKQFKKPEIEEIENYMIERGFSDTEQPEAFYDYFEANGWHVGKVKMKDWKAAVRNWIRNAKKWSKRDERTQASYRNNQTFADRQRQVAAESFAELEAMERGNGKDLLSSLH